MNGELTFARLSRKRYYDVSAEKYSSYCTFLPNMCFVRGVHDLHPRLQQDISFPSSIAARHSLRLKNFCRQGVEHNITRYY